MVTACLTWQCANSLGKGGEESWGGWDPGLELWTHLPFALSKVLLDLLAHRLVDVLI